MLVIVDVHNFADRIENVKSFKMLEYRSKNKVGFEAERLKVCSAAKRMFAVFRPIFQCFDLLH